MSLGAAPPQGTLELILVTAIITSIVVGVFGKRAAEFVLNLLLRPLRFLGRTIYGWIAPRNPLSISLRTYRKHLLRSNLTRLESPIGIDITIELERAFAPLKLISAEANERVDLFAYSRKAFRSIVLGGPGTGKTTLMKSLVVNTYSRKLQPDAPNLIAVFVVLRNLAKSQHTVQQAIVASFAAHHFPGADRFVELALNAGRLLIVLDGLDEVGQSRELVIQEIRRFCEYDDQRDHRNRLFITCRQHSYRTLDLGDLVPNVLHVEPFANEHMRAFLQGWPTYRGRMATGLYTLLQSDARIRDICRNPLLLTILTGLYLVSERFELPTSRQRFYQAAIDELLMHRPARRGIRQVFDPEVKRQILERVSLDRLESFLPNDDPEEFSLEAIRKYMRDLLPEAADARELVNEMVDLNGILKPARDDDCFTCAHRTIQEYFAAREAVRRRTVEEVLLTTAERPELIEMLYFYCGLIENIPVLARIIDTLSERQEWLVAARALAQMKEPPSAEAVNKIAGMLQTLVASGRAMGTAMELLSTLASRRDSGFSGATAPLRAAVDTLATRDATGGASALETAISASPEIAMRLIPVLLTYTDRRWKESAVQLLGDIATDEALDQLVRLLESPDPYLKYRAALTLTRLMPTRSADISARATLLRDQANNAIWPLPAHFPSRIMIPMAESLAQSLTDDELIMSNVAVCSAMRAVEAQRQGSGEKFMKRWRHVARDYKLRMWLRRLSSCLKPVAFAVALVPFISLAVAPFAGDRVFFVSVSASPVKEIAGARASEIRRAVRQVADRILAATAPDAVGWKRLLPWHWFTEPALPGSAKVGYDALRSWGERTVRGQAAGEITASLGQFESLVPDSELAELRRTLLPFQGAAYQCQHRDCALLLSGGIYASDVIDVAILALLLVLYRSSRARIVLTGTAITPGRAGLERVLVSLWGLAYVALDSLPWILLVWFCLVPISALLLAYLVLDSGRLPLNPVLDLLESGAERSGILPLS